MTGPETSSPISFRESQELATHVRRQAAVAKSMVGVRAAEVLADFEEQLAREYSWDDHDVWSKAKAAVDLSIAKANTEIEEACRRLGIPKSFAPSIPAGWYGRGNISPATGRLELRGAATRRIAALSKAAKAHIEQRSVEIQAELLAGRLTTEAARAFLAAMPTADQLMPTLDLSAVKQQVEGGNAQALLGDLLH